MRRRHVAAGIAALALPVAVTAQPGGRMRRLGVLDWSSSEDRVVFDGLMTALRDLGYEEGRNLAIDYRAAEGDMERAERFAAELTRQAVDLIVAISAPAAQAAKRATQTIPIVFHVSDPISAGLVSNLARPGGNLTGVSLAITDIAAKNLELLRELMPAAHKAAFLGRSQRASYLNEIEAGARRLGIAVVPFFVAGADDLEAAMGRIAAEAVNVLYVQTLLLQYRTKIAALAGQHRLPWIAERADAAHAGALFAYGADRLAMIQRLAPYVDRVLRGEAPGNLPIEQPTRFHFVVNLRSARAFGLTVPPAMLARADEFIE